jgi:hypothetical protein
MQDKVSIDRVEKLWKRNHKISIYLLFFALFWSIVSIFIDSHSWIHKTERLIFVLVSALIILDRYRIWKIKKNTEAIEEILNS